MRKLWILIKDNLINSLRTKRAILFLLLYLGMFFLFSYGFIRVQEKIFMELEKQGIDESSRKILTSTFKFCLKSGNEEKIIDFLLSVPFFNTALFLITIFGTPLLILIVKHDILAREIYDGTFRFLTFRVSRNQIIVSRLIGSVVEFALITLLALGGATLWANASIPGFPLEKSFRAGLGFWLRSQFFLLIFISFSLMVSVIVRKPFLALLVSCIGILILLLLPFWLDYVSPFDIKYISGLFYGPSPELFSTLAVYLGFSALFFVIGAMVFKRKNL